MLNAFLSLFAPHICLGCSAEGTVLCAACTRRLPRQPSVCYRCGTATQNYATCVACRRSSRLSAVYVVTKYEALAKDAVWQLKFAGAQAAAKDIGRMMADMVPSPSGFFIVPAPTATSHVRRRGYDQACLLAGTIARRLPAAYTPCLVRVGQQRQVGAGRKQRFMQLDGAFRLARGYDLSGAHIMLVDDVLTTGATLEAAAATLRKAGAKRVEAIVFARA